MAELRIRRCELSKEGKRAFPTRFKRCPTGVVVGELRLGRTCYSMLFDDLTTASIYHKNFITILKEEDV